MAKIGIVIPTLNQFQLAIEAIESIKTVHEVIIFPILNYRNNLSLSGAWNLGVKRAVDYECDYVLIINDDILFSPWTIDALVEKFEDAEPDVIMVTGWNVREQINAVEDIYSWPKFSENLWGENPDFACFMVRPDITDKIGNFDENFAPAYFEDNDYHYRINLSGHKAIFTARAPYYHYGSRTQNSDPNFPVVPGPIFQINQLHYINKWGGEPGKERFQRPFDDPEKTFRDW